LFNGKQNSGFSCQLNLAAGLTKRLDTGKLKRSFEIMAQYLQVGFSQVFSIQGTK
jgi:hypothetical protein